MRVDVAVLGMPRTGTTLVANLMTDPEAKRWCAVEPGGYGNRNHPRLFKRARLLGFNPDSTDRVDLERLIDSLDRFGVKEVHRGQYGGALKQGPSRVVACVRDIRDVVVSLADPRFVHSKRVPQPEGIALQAAQFVGLVDNLEAEVSVCRYEDFAGSPAYRDRLAEEIDWPLTGDPSRNLKRYKRGDEVRSGVKSRRGPEDRLAFEKLHGSLDAYAEAARVYQDRFGFA